MLTASLRYDKEVTKMKTIDDLKKYIAGYCNECKSKKYCETDLILCTGAEMVIISYRMIMKGEY